MRTPKFDTSRPDRRGSFILLFCCLLVVGAGNTMIISAVLPPLTRQLGLPDWTAGAIFSLSAAAWSITSPFWGRASDRMGRRTVTAIGMGGYTLSMVFFGCAMLVAQAGWISEWYWIFLLFLFSRAIFGILGSGGPPAAQAYVADRTSEEERTDELAFLTSGFSVGSIAGPAFAASIITLWGLVSPLFVAAIIAGIMTFLVMTKLPENTPPQSIEPTRLSSGGLWRRPEIAPLLIYGIALSLSTGIFIQTFPFAMIDRMGLEGTAAAQYLGPAMAMGAMATLAAQWVFIPRLKLSPNMLMISGGILLSIGCMILIPAQDFSVFATAQIIFGLGQGFTRAGFTGGASIKAGPGAQGDVAGLVISANGLGFVISPFFGPWLYQYAGYGAPFWFNAVLTAIMASFIWLVVERMDHTEDKNTHPD